MGRRGSHRHCPLTIDVVFRAIRHARRVESSQPISTVFRICRCTNRIFIMHRRLALAYADAFPLKILLSLIAMLRLVEMINGTNIGIGIRAWLSKC
jgi:hypothetical protein